MLNNFIHSTHRFKLFVVHQLISFICLSFILFSSQVNADVAGKTILAKGEVKAVNNTSAETRKLKRRSKIFSVDNITTGRKSKAQFSMSDGGLITLKENTEINISDYRFDDGKQEGSATLEVVSGGLRSISGLIKKSGGDYQVNTPVGSIGIRGTHFAVQVVGDKVFFGVFSGDIDVKLHNQQVLSLGEHENYSFASVNSLGHIKFLTQAPVEISNNIIVTTSSARDAEESNISTQTSITATTTEVRDSQMSGYMVSTAEENNYADIYNESELQGVDGSPIADLIAQRTGTLSYHNVGEGVIHSTAGNVSDFTIGMTIDFDQASIPEGSLSFSDDDGQWFAVFSGLINVDQLDMGINFASHGNNKAKGEISAAFSNGLEEIIGSFALEEVQQTDVKAGGSFKVTP